MDTANDITHRFNIKPSHSLIEQNTSKKKQPNNVCETRWYIEKDEQQQVVARYRSWLTQATQPPYKKQVGWERYSACGTLLDREVRYSSRDNNDYLH